MASAIAVLRELHRLRRHMKNLQEEIQRAPRLLKAKQTALARQEDDLKSNHDKLNELKVLVRKHEGALKQEHQQIARWEGQLREISSKKEYDALQHEIGDARKRCAALEDQILETMSQADDQTTRIPELEKGLKKTREEQAQFEKTSQERVVTLEAEYLRAQGQIKEVEQQLPQNFRELYDRLVSARGDDALSMALDRTCSTCNTGLTAQQTNDLLAGRLVQCKACGRIVYVAEDS